MTINYNKTVIDLLIYLQAVKLYLCNYIQHCHRI